MDHSVLLQDISSNASYHNTTFTQTQIREFTVSQVQEMHFKLDSNKSQINSRENVKFFNGKLSNYLKINTFPLNDS